MIKAILFDYGGVMTDGGRGKELSDRLATALDISPEEGFALLGPVWDDYSRGKITQDQLWQTIETGYGQPIPIDKRGIWNTWEDHMQPQPEMVELVKQLKKEYRVGLLSNVIPNTAADIQSHGGYDVFDFVVLSSEAGYAKPQPEIYQLALGQLPDIQPSEVIFVDDQTRFLLPAQELGIKTILARDWQQIAADIQALIANNK